MFFFSVLDMLGETMGFTPHVVFFRHGLEATEDATTKISRIPPARNVASAGTRCFFCWVAGVGCDHPKWRCYWGLKVGGKHHQE
jgi:hypothetical protein